MGLVLVKEARVVLLRVVIVGVGGTTTLASIVHYLNK
jgi:Tfp pilus assembly pilus retraction ATPase PilT